MVDFNSTELKIGLTTGWEIKVNLMVSLEIKRLNVSHFCVTEEKIVITS